MTIYVVAAEDTDVVFQGLGVGGVGTQYRAQWARGALSPNYNAGVNRGSTASDPPIDRIQLPAFTPISTLWTHAQLGQQSTPTSGAANQQLIRWLDAGGVCRICFRLMTAGVNPQWGCFKRSAAGVFTQLGSSFNAALISGAPGQPVDFYINYGASGTITVYISGVQVFTYTGDTTTDGNTTLASLELADYMNSYNGYYTFWSEVIVSSTDTRSMGLWLMNSNTTGTNATWTGTASNVNKSVISDTTYITSATANQIQDYKPSGGGGSGGLATPSGIWNVSGLVISGRALNATTGPQHLEAGFNIAGTHYWSADQTLITSFGNFSNLVWNTNPGTSAAWTIGDITSATFNYSIQSTA